MWNFQAILLVLCHQVSTWQTKTRTTESQTNPQQQYRDTKLHRLEFEFGLATANALHNINLPVISAFRGEVHSKFDNSNSNEGKNLQSVQSLNIWGDKCYFVEIFEVTQLKLWANKI